MGYGCTIFRDDWQFHIVNGLVTVSEPMDICSEKCIQYKAVYFKSWYDV